VFAITSRHLTAVVGVLLGLGAFVVACQALTAVLVNWRGEVAGLLTGAVLLAVVAAAAFSAVLRPDAEVQQEAHEVKAAAAHMLAGLPGNAIAALIRKHLTVVLVPR
jgi:membrane protein implicated in regulation of membrane protease activity